MESGILRSFYDSHVIILNRIFLSIVMSFYTLYNLKAEWDFKSHQDSYLLDEWVF